MAAFVQENLLSSSGTYAYVAVKASLHATDSAVFGLNKDEKEALSKRFTNDEKTVVNGLVLKGSPIDIINTLSQIGYRVVACTGEVETIWTLQRDL